MIEFKYNSLVITLNYFDVDDYCKLMGMLVFATRHLSEDSTYYPDAYLLSVLIEEMLPSADQLRKCKDS